MRKRGAAIMLLLALAWPAAGHADHAPLPTGAPAGRAAEARPLPAESPGLPAAPSPLPGSRAEAAPAASSGAPAYPCFFDEMAEEAVAALALSGRESDVERIKRAYRYVIARTSYIEYDQPELIDSWRYHDRCGKPPTCYQVMGAGPLLYGIGTCENYSAALMMLLHQLGYESLYVTGLTFSVSGTLVDHAWVMVQVDGAWYHIDPQLEDNAMRGAYIHYRYFLKSDEAFAAHHVWADGLPSPDARSLRLPKCQGSLPAQPGEALEQQAVPAVAELVAHAAQQQAAHRGPVCRLEAGTLPALPRDMRPALDEPLNG